MKKYVTISLFVFWAITVAVITAGLVLYNQNTETTKINTNKGSNLLLSKTELNKHNNRQSCWLLISEKIYDVTSFLNGHPGGASTILPTCGTDATKAYASRGGTGSHSSSAYAMLADYYIGDLNQTVTTSPNNQNSPPIANPNPIQPKYKNYDDD